MVESQHNSLAPASRLDRVRYPADSLNQVWNLRMANLTQVLKNEITRLARKEIRLGVEPLRKSNAALRTDIAKLRKQLADQARELAALRKGAAGQGKRTAPAATPDAAPKQRISTDGIKSLRAKLGLTAEQMGALIGVSGQSVYLWERGTTKPRAKPIAALIALRGASKADVIARLEALQAEAPKPKKAPAKKAAAKKAPAKKAAGRKPAQKKPVRATKAPAAPRKRRVAKKATAPAPEVVAE